MCDFYGMNTKINNKYDNDPKYLLAQKQFKKYFKETQNLKNLNTLIRMKTLMTDHSLDEQHEDK